MPYGSLHVVKLIICVTLGGDATESFEDVGHSSDARTLMKDYLIGELVEVAMKDKIMWYTI